MAQRNQTIHGRISINTGGPDTRKLQGNNRQKTKGKNRRRMGTEQKNKPSLKHMNEGKIKTPAKYLSNSQKSKMFCQARVGDLYSITGEESPKKCQICQETTDCILQHIIKDCQCLTQTRTALGKTYERRQWASSLLEDDSPEMRDTIGELLIEWGKTRNEHK